MKKTGLVLLLTLSLLACKKKKGIPDVSDIKVDIPIERFDRTFFAIDSNNMEQGLKRLQKEHPEFYNDFMNEILGVTGSISDNNTLLITKQFISGYTSIYDSVKGKFSNMTGLKKELQKGFQFVKYYFPDYKIGKAIIYLGPFNAPGVASTNAGLAIGLQQFAGSNFSVYQSEPIQQMFPSYITRRFAPEYITANCMKAVVDELFPDKSSGKPLIEQMIEKGKQWFLLDKFLPSTADSLKTGYTQKQLSWCTENEGLIWNYLVKNEDLNSLNPTTIQSYIGEGPFTQGFSQELSPGNIGQWIGWQIVKKYMSKNPGMKPAEAMKIDAGKILTEGKYKPK